MDLRRLLNVVHAHLLGDPDRDGYADRARMLAEELDAPFDFELTDRERKRIEYRRLARAIGADRGQEALMNAFKTPTTGAART